MSVPKQTHVRVCNPKNSLKVRLSPPYLWLHPTNSMELSIFFFTMGVPAYFPNPLDVNCDGNTTYAETVMVTAVFGDIEQVIISVHLHGICVYNGPRSLYGLTF